MSADAVVAADSASTLSELNRALDALSMRAGWNKREPSLWPFPRTGFRPFLWRWRDARAALDAAGTAHHHCGNRTAQPVASRIRSRTTPTRACAHVVCAYQMILPGERARSHRHSPNALRLVLEAGGDVYTVVDGARLDMGAGDVVLTPGWCWHGHANDGDAPAYWVDFLDVPLVHLLEPMFLENWPDGFQVPDRVETESAWLFDWESTRSALDAGSVSGPGATRADTGGDPGARVELGSPALPTIALHMQQASPRAWRRVAHPHVGQSDLLRGRRLRIDIGGGRSVRVGARRRVRRALLAPISAPRGRGGGAVQRERRARAARARVSAGRGGVAERVSFADSRSPSGMTETDDSNTRIPSMFLLRLRGQVP